MKKYNKALVALLVAALGVAGVAGIASARGWHGSHGGGCYGQGGYGPGYGHGGGRGYGQGAMNLSPEVRGMMEKTYAETAPLFMELRAKQTELTAKIYSGADDKTIQDLSRQVNDLQARLNDARVKTQQQLAKAGVPLNGVGPCPGMGGGMGGGMGFHGRMHGFGYHGGGYGYGPCAGYAQPGNSVGDSGN